MNNGTMTMPPRVRRPARRDANLRPTPQSPPPEAPPPGGQPPAQQQRHAGLKAIKEMLFRKKEAIARVIPPNVGLNVDGLVQNALQQIIKDRKLMFSRPVSVLDAVLAAAAVGLDFVADQAYLVAHEKKKRDPFTGAELHEAWVCSFWPGYKGMITVAARYGWTLDVQDVRGNDQIEISKGTENRITHKVGFGGRGEIVGVYCVVRDRQHRVCSIETMDMQDIAAVRKKTDVWKYHEGQMSRKSVVRRAYKFLPKDNSQMRLLAEVDERFEEGQDIHDLLPNAGEPDEAGDYLGAAEGDDAPKDVADEADAGDQPA